MHTCIHIYTYMRIFSIHIHLQHDKVLSGLPTNMEDSLDGHHIQPKEKKEKHSCRTSLPAELENNFLLTSKK